VVVAVVAVVAVVVVMMTLGHGGATWVKECRHNLVQRVLASSCYNCGRGDRRSMVGGEDVVGVREKGGKAFCGTER
jgi:hypothetical protein